MDCDRYLVGIVTMAGDPWELESNFQRLASHVREAARRRARLVVAPESVLDGYVCGADPDVARAQMVQVAQAIPGGPYLQRAGALCRELGIYLVFGFLELDGDDLFNACALLGPDGTVAARFRKVHTAGEAFITPGGELKPFDTPLGRLGFLLCKDREVPDNFHVLAIQGVEVVILPMDGSGGRHNTEKLIQRARDACCWIVLANTWSAVMISPGGELFLERYESECVSVQRLELAAVPRGAGRTRLRERRYDLYGILTRSLEDERYYDDAGRPTPLADQFGAEHRRVLRERKGKQAEGGERRGAGGK